MSSEVISRLLHDLGAKWPMPIFALFDLLDHHHSHATMAPDPHMDAFAVTLVVSLLSAVTVIAIVILFLCFPGLPIRVRRIRDLFWVIPSANLTIYLISITLRTYPGGFVARLRPPGLWYTLVEVFLVLILSLLTAAITACGTWLLRKIRGPKSKPKEESRAQVIHSERP